MDKDNVCVSTLSCYECSKVYEKYTIWEKLTLATISFLTVYGIIAEVVTGECSFYGHEFVICIAAIAGLVVEVVHTFEYYEVLLPAEIVFFERHLVLRRKSLYSSCGDITEKQIRFDYEQILNVHYDKENQRLSVLGKGVTFSRLCVKDAFKYFAAENKITECLILVCPKEIEGILYHMAKAGMLNIDCEL